ncbi:MAG: class I SAM-dependent methyltransferase [Sandaracinaceae bacterium]
MSSCPACGGATVAVERIDARHLRRLWRLALGVDADAELDRDGALSLHRCAGCGTLAFAPRREASPAFYDRLRRRPWYEPGSKREFRLAAELLPPGARILDLGGGCGAFARAAPHLEVTVVEAGTPWPEGRFDGGCAFQVLEHVAEPLALLRRLAASVRPGGRLVVGVPNAESYLDRLENLPLDGPPHHLSRFTPAGLRRLAARAGLAAVVLLEAPVEPWERTLHAMATRAPRRGPYYPAGATAIARLVGARILAALRPTEPASGEPGATLVAVGRAPGPVGPPPAEVAR